MRMRTSNTNCIAANTRAAWGRNTERYSARPAIRPLRCKGFGFLGWLATIPIAIIALLILAFGFYEGRKAYWDSKVREMCAKDGGVTVFETVRVSAEQYNRLPITEGSVAIVSEAISKPEEPAFSVDKQTVLRESAPRVIRWEKLVKRRADGKIIGSLVSYHRLGGDTPLTYGHPTRFSCPDSNQYYGEQRKFFAIEGKAK